MDVQKRDITFENLRYQYGTGRAYTISGTGRNRVTGYRVGVQTKLGDFEISEWMDLMQDLIEKSGEQALHAALIEWLSEHNYRKASKSDIAREAMELHSNRIFDREEWADFLPFNRRYRPDALSGVETVDVFMDCCQQWGAVTRRRLECDRSIYGKRVSCPICGRLSEYQSEESENEKTSEEAESVKEPPTAEKIGLAAKVALKQVRKTLLEHDLKYRLSDFSYPAMDGEICNQEAANSVRCVMIQRESFDIYVSLSYKCRRMGRRLKKFIKDNLRSSDIEGAQSTRAGIVFVFSVNDLLHTK